MKNPSKKRSVLNFVVSCAGFFILSSICVTVTFIIFLDKASLPRNLMSVFEPYVTINLLLISVIYASLSMSWHRRAVERPFAKIDEALSRIKKGEIAATLNTKEYSDRYSDIVTNINSVSDELSSIGKLKVSFLSNVSHELKTPISIISNYAELLQDDNLTDKCRIEYAEAISASAKTMTDFINGILKLNQLENQHIPNETKQYNLSEQLCECLLSFEEIWEEREIEIFTEIEDEVYVKSDMQLMNIVWSNLLSNAFKFTPDGGAISVKVTEEDDFAVVEISDTGCGIPEHLHASIFDKFFQADSSRATGGHGLGLALVKRVITITDSKIDVSSREGLGTTFTVRISK